MKKLLLVLAIGAFAACGDASEGEATNGTSTVDSAAMAPAPAPDTTTLSTDTSAAAATTDSAK